MPFALPVDVHEGLFRTILNGACFEAWVQPHRCWQLHISGGPGSGKTTLAALIARRLWRDGTAPVAFLHVHHDETSHAQMRDDTPSYDPASPSEKFLCPDGSIRTGVISVSSSGTDFEDICKILVGQLGKSKIFSLIIDDYDKIQSSVQDRLQQNLCHLQSQGLKVLLLSAAPEPELDPSSLAWLVECNNCRRGQREGGLNIYWRCNLCDCDLCDTCKTTGNHCADPQHPMFEPYGVVSMKLVTELSELECFARTDLEAEYGSGISHDIVEAVCDPSEGNINLAKLRLDQIRDLESPSDIMAASDRLPREVVAFFDAEIKRIDILSPLQRYQTLLAIIAIADAGDRMSVSELEELLSHVGSSRIVHSDRPYSQVRRVLKSARGLLSSFILYGPLSPEQENLGRHWVALYITDLGYYIREDYNQDLVLAKQYFRQARAGELDLDHIYSFERSVHGRRGDMPLTRHNELSYENVTDCVLREPEGICTPCQRRIFSSMSNSGVRSWSGDSDHAANLIKRTDCHFCRCAYKELNNTQVSSVDFRWTRRTMGRTYNSNDHMVVTLRYTGSPVQRFFRRFVFMLKSELGVLPSRDSLGDTTSLKHTGEQIRKWLKTCTKEHAHCNYNKVESYVPKRLLDINTGVLDRLRIITREEKEEGPYVTLSHSWGRNPNFLRLTTEKKAEMMNQGFLIGDLRNKNFANAIEVARNLKVRYIWIDSLCICQAGKDKDFKEEGHYMHLVYQNSLCNIVAADSRDGQGGLFRKRPSESPSITYTRGSWVAMDKELWKKELLQSPIYTRGWVFQERMLSPRIIHFTRSEVFWDCSTVSACESLPDGLPFPLSAIATADRRWRGRLQRKNSNQDGSSLAVEDSLEKFWKGAVLNYTSCDLTDQSDKTSAIWSVAKLVRDNLPDEYGCGLWSAALHEQLAWRVKVTRNNSRMASLQWLFPSWSWASVNAPVLVQDRIVPKRCYTIKSHQGGAISFGDFKDKTTDRDTEPEFAASVSLAVRGYLIHGHLEKSTSDTTHTFLSKEVGLEQEYRVIIDEEISEARLRSQFYLMPLAAHKTSDDATGYAGSALVLTATDDYRKLTRAKLMEQILHLVNLSQLQPVRNIPNVDQKADLKDELRSLCLSIDALNKCRHKLAKQDREFPLRQGNAFRRIGVAYFHDLAAKEWACITSTRERLIWLD